MILFESFKELPLFWLISSLSLCRADGIYPEDDVLTCNRSNTVGQSSVRTVQLLGQLIPVDFGRPLSASVKFQFVRADALWGTNVQYFCDVMSLEETSRANLSNASKLNGPDAFPTSSGNMLVTYLPVQLNDEHNLLGCLKGESWIRHVHSIIELGLIIVYPANSNIQYNVSRLSAAFNGIRFPFIFIPNSDTLENGIGMQALSKDFFASGENVSCSLTLKGEVKSLDLLLNSFSRTSVLFVSVSFIILMLISLVWLVFYYVQRFRYAHAKDRLARRLFNAARKTLNKLPVKTMHSNSSEVVADCPICIEQFSSGDMVRTLMCNHTFHRSCVDPWLLQHRTCPLCKLDILKAVGCCSKSFVDSMREENCSAVGGRVPESLVNFTQPSAGTISDLHDPFFPTPLPSPPVVQQVLHPDDARCNSILSLTVHGNRGRPTDIPLEKLSSNSAKRASCNSGEACSTPFELPNVEHGEGAATACAKSKAEQNEKNSRASSPGIPVLSYFQSRVHPVESRGTSKHLSSECRQPGSLEKNSNNSSQASCGDPKA